MDKSNNSGTNDGQQIPPEVRTFLESILADANITSLDETSKEETLKELYVRLDNFMLTTIVEGLPSDKLEEFTKLAEAGKSREELEDYLKENIPDATEVFSRAMLDFRDFYLGNIAVARNAPVDNQSGTAAPGVKD